ncbi:MAG: hypothetical protein M3R72_05295 [Bacteroidota bacterium]|nr:hypothetical protein [Bacteroidota bacterium]
MMKYCVLLFFLLGSSQPYFVDDIDDKTITGKCTKPKADAAFVLFAMRITSHRKQVTNDLFLLSKTKSSLKAM